MAIDDFFLDKDLFPSLDYHLHAHTLPRGMIYIGLDLFTDEAKTLRRQITKISIPVDDESLNLGLLQILAEKEQKLAAPGTDNAFMLDPIRKELQGVDEKPWQDIDEVDVIDPRDHEMIAGSLYLPQKKESLPARKTTVAITIDRQFAEARKELLPLFWEIASLISESVMANLYATSGFYSHAITYQPKHQATKLAHQFRVPHTYPLEVLNTLAEVEDTLLHLHEALAFKRLVTELRNASNSDLPQTFPGPHYLFERTNVFIGARGWRRIATDENCHSILSHMKVTVSAGRSRASLKVAPLLDTE